MRSAIESACPRTIAASLRVSLRGGSGRRALPPARPGRSAAKETSSSGWRAIARRHPITARLNGSVGASFAGVLLLMFEDMLFSLPPVARRGDRSSQRDVHGGFRKLLAEAALIELRYDRPFQFIALVQESETEGKADVFEDLGVLPPRDDGARAHDGRNVAVHERVAGQIGDADHFVDDVAALVIAIVFRLRKHDLDLVVMRQI